MKKLRDFLGSGDRPRLLLSAFAVGLMLIVALLLPLAFRGPVSQEPTPEAPGRALAEDKRQLFADYWLLGAEESGVAVSRLEETLTPETTQTCEDAMRALVALCIDDQKLDYAAPDGSEYTLIRDERGTQVRLCRMWLEARGDWQNWLDVCFDVDSGEVYYLYLSRECLTNRTAYKNSPRPEAADVAAVLEEHYGWTLRWLDGQTALFTTGDGSACYQIESRCYDALIDVKICCR